MNVLLYFVAVFFCDHLILLSFFLATFLIISFFLDHLVCAFC